jgi:5-formyltetrahydrofolate cyclo-ligase
MCFMAILQPRNTVRPEDEEGGNSDATDLLAAIGTSMTSSEVTAWRREKRAELLAARERLSSHERDSAAKIIGRKLDHLCASLTPATIGLYWPIKHEPSLLPWGRALAQSGDVRLCLPVVVAPRSPLEYWRWVPGDSMQTGFWNIPRPVHRDVVVPDLILAPLVGFDRANYRLGYGGGYFDRTLAVLPQRPVVVGIGYAFSALPTIFPQPHDVALDVILTEQSDETPQPEQPV